MIVKRKGTKRKMEETKKVLVRSEAVELLKTVAARLPEVTRNIALVSDLKAMCKEIEGGDIGYVDDDIDPAIAKITHHLYFISDSPISRQTIDWDLIQKVGDGSNMNELAVPILSYLYAHNPEGVEDSTIHRRDVAETLTLFTKAIRSFFDEKPAGLINYWQEVLDVTNVTQEVEEVAIPTKEAKGSEEFLTKKEVKSILLKVASMYIEENQK